jgi:hypothetical protein
MKSPYPYHSHPSGETYRWLLKGANPWDPDMFATVEEMTLRGASLGAPGAGRPTPGSGAEAYFEVNPDVAQAYAAEDYGFTADQFAAEHWMRFGRNEQRFSPDQLLTMRSRTYTDDEVEAALRVVLDGGASLADAIRAAWTGYRIPEHRVQAAHQRLMTPAAPPPVAPPPVARPPIDTSVYLPPGWTQGSGVSAILPTERPTVPPGIQPVPLPGIREIEAMPYGGAPIPGLPGGGVIEPLPPGGPASTSSPLPLPLLAAGAAVAAFLLTRR